MQNRLSLVATVLFASTFIVMDVDMSCAQGISASTVIENHSNTINSIHTLSCRISITWKDYDPHLMDESADVVWKSGKMRIRHTSGGKVKNDVLVDMGIVKSQSILGTNKNDYSRVFGTIVNNDMPYLCDPWCNALLTVPGTKRFRLPLKELYQDIKNQVTKFEVEPNGASRQYRIDIVQPKIDMSIVIDPDHGHLISEILYRSSKSDSVVNKVESFIQTKTGAYFPQSIKSQVVNSNKFWHTTFSNIRINETIPDTAFAFQFEPGILVTDSIKRDVFITNERGEPVLPAKNSRGDKMTFTDQFPPSASPELTDSRTATTEESKYQAGVLIVIASLILVLIGIFLTYRNRRRI